MKLNIIIFMTIFNCLTALDRFPQLTPYRTGMLQVDEVHSIYWEESGNPDGVPVLFLHGGPGLGTDRNCRTFFDPTFYRIILFDQRGCGKSTPNRCLTNNTTWDLVEDIHKLRHFLSIDRCLLFGGSWGSTLALAYAIRYPEKVSGMILRGVFLCRQQELDWFYREGASRLSPQAWRIFLSPIPPSKRTDLIYAYREALHSDSYQTRIQAAAAWTLWEYANLHFKPDHRLSPLLNFKFAFSLFSYLLANQNLTIAQIQNHYFLHNGFFKTDNWILNNIHRIKNIPGVIIQGEEDRICPWENAAELHDQWTNSTFLLVPNGGHSSDEPCILKALIQATEDFKSILHFDN